MEFTAQELYEKKAKSYKLLLLFGMISILMIFAGFTSAYVVSKSRPDWLTDFVLPSAFTWSTVAIFLSSISFYFALKTTKLGKTKQTSSFLVTTLVLGLTFIYLQFKGFEQVINQGYFFTGSYSNVTTSFLYIVVLVHIIHLLGGIISLLIVIYNHFKQKYNVSQYLGIELSAYYWHFMDFIWIYLFLFFYFFK